MNLRDLKYLVALAEHRHFGRAALASNVTQPALSNALRSLEESYGTAIVKRGRTFGGFTTEGERILDSARRILREHELLEQDLHSREPQRHVLEHLPLEVQRLLVVAQALLAEGMPGGAFPCGCRATLGSAVRQGDRANAVDPTACGTGAVDGVCGHGMLR